MASPAASSGNWIKQFGISESDLAGVRREQGGSDSEALRICLMSGKISEPEYLEWAMNTFSLPAVTGDFFTAVNDAKFWSSVKDLHPWNPGFFPLTEWDGVYLIACLEPPREFKFPYPHRFVLASARHLLLVWESLTSQVSAEMPDGILMNAAAQLSQSAPTDNTHSTFNGFDAPDGLGIDATAIAPRSETPDGLIGTSTLPDLRAEPDGLRAEHEDEHHDEHQEAATQILSASAAVSAPTSAQVARPPLEPEHPVEAPMTVPTETPADEDGEEEGKVAVTATNFTLSTTGLRPLGSALSLNALGTLALAHVMAHFDAAMILLTENATGKLKPWKWSENLTSPVNAEFAAVDPAQPSAFRVVIRSRQAFHGQMPASDVNNAFANAFTAGKLPVVTMIPVIDGKNLVGVIVGLTTKSRSYKQVLGPMGEIADQFGKQLARLNKANAA